MSTSGVKLRHAALTTQRGLRALRPLPRRTRAVLAGATGFLVTITGLIWIVSGSLFFSCWPMLTFLVLLSIYVGLGVWDCVLSGAGVLLQLTKIGLAGFTALAALLWVVQLLA